MTIGDGNLIRAKGSPVDGEQVTEAVPFITVTESGDDAGVNISGELSVGTPLVGKEFISGGGDSYPVGTETGVLQLGSAWHCTTANTTGTTITSATDVTEILSTDSGSSIGLFNGTAAGNYILFGSDAEFRGFKAKMAALGIVEPLNIVGEYLASDDAWVDVRFMATNADFPYQQYGNTLASCNSCSEQWRFGFNPDYFPDVMWEAKTLNINDTNYTKRWARIRITSAITLDPTLEQIKLHTDRFESNADGTTELFGVARYPSVVHIEKHGNATKNPPNENIEVGVGITEIRTDNEFVNNASDGLILSGIVPVGLDTSIPVQVIIDWYPKTSGTGDVELELELVAATMGFVYDGTSTPVAATPIITTVSNQENELQRSTFWIDVSGALPNDKVYGSLFRDATSGNADDTLAGNIVITGYQVVGYFWRP